MMILIILFFNLFQSHLLDSVKAKFKRERPPEDEMVQEMAKKYRHAGSGRKRKAEDDSSDVLHKRRNLVGIY